MALLIESNGKLAIKQMEFKLESQKLELESHAQTQTIQLAIIKMFKDTLHVFKDPLPQLAPSRFVFSSCHRGFGVPTSTKG